MKSENWEVLLKAKAHDVSQRQDRPELIVSVESRKGGVGKTTAALCLARILLERGYTVLVLDLDFTGTNAADIAASPFWVSDLHIIREVDEKGDDKNPLNLLTLFDQGFMAGIPIPSFSTQGVPSKTLLVNLMKVNVIGSQIYKTRKEPGEGKWTTSVERPAMLFDDLHTLWLLEFVQQIIADFARVASRRSDAKTAIILDNSPGYVGIAPAIHDWLTDSGPDCGKFLIVTSLDAQDLQACERAVDALHGLYTGKWQTSRLLIAAGETDDAISLDHNQETFFMRLASSARARSAEADPLAFYRRGTETSSQQECERGQTFCDQPSEYIAAIINRVPRAVKIGRLLYEHHYSPSANEGATLSRLLGGKDARQRWRDRMVSYDEYIENQFLLQLLRRAPDRSVRRVHRLIETLNMAEHELHTGTHETGEDAIRLFATDCRHQERLWVQLARANDILIRARSAVDEAGFGHLARLIHDEWLPGSIVQDFRSALFKLLRESDFPFFEMLPFDDHCGPANTEAREFVDGLKEHIVMELRHARERQFHIADNWTVDTLAGVLSGLVGLSLTGPMWHSPLRKEISGLFAGVLAIELRHWAKKGEERSSKYGMQRFLAQESLSQAEFRKSKEMFEHFRFFRHHMMEEGEAGLIDFYSACTTAQARLIDFIADSRFLLQLLVCIVKGEIERGNLFPFVRGIAEDVIIRKTLPHDEAPNKMATALQTAEYFREFDDVLGRVLKDWGVQDE